MGLFGIVYTAFVLGAKGYMGIKKSINDSNAREKAKNEGKEIYVGEDGIGRCVKDGRPVIHCYEYLNGYNEKPDRVLKYAGTNEIIRNFSEENRKQTQEQSYKIAKEKGYTVYRIGEKFDDHFHDKCRGFRYKDIQTGKIYVIREVCGCKYYMDVKTGLLVRKTDGQIEKEKYNAENNPICHKLNQKRDEEHVMENFNKKQLEYSEKYGLSFRNDLFSYE